MVFAIIILFDPDIQILQKSIESIKGSVSEILLIDNSKIKNNLEELLENWRYENSCNLSYFYNGNIGGIAGAHNIGIKFFMQSACEYLLILDQDSIPFPNMISELKKGYDFLSKKYKIACIGPSEKENVHSLIEVSKVSEIKSSGAFFDKQIFNIIGLMEAQLFIDAVDSEWCWRAREKGYFTFVISNAKMKHFYGEGNKGLLGLSIAISAPFRTYYQFRNYIFMLKRSYVPLRWKIKNGFKYMVKFVAYPLLTKNSSYFKYMLKGISDGLSNKYGEITNISR